MFLLSEELIERYIRKERIAIDPFFGENLYPTCYYFSLGRLADVPGGPNGMQTVNVERQGYIVIPPKSVASVESLEHFRLPDNILALLGNRTELLRKQHLQLLHGPTIDPGWKQQLALAIHNFGDSPERVEFKAKIGKAMFFDISDSALEEARLTPEGRRRVRELQREVT